MNYPDEGDPVEHLEGIPGRGGGNIPKAKKQRRAQAMLGPSNCSVWLSHRLSGYETERQVEGTHVDFLSHEKVEPTGFLEELLLIYNPT